MRGGTQRLPVAVHDTEGLRGLGGIAYAREPHFTVFHAAEVRIQQCEFAPVIAGCTRARAVPHQAYDGRQRARRFARRHRQVRVEVGLCIEHLRIGLRAGRGRNIKFEHAAAGVAVARHLCVIAVVPRFEIEVVELAARFLRCALGADDIEVEPEVVERVGVFERQAVDEAARVPSAGIG